MAAEKDSMQDRHSSLDGMLDDISCYYPDALAAEELAKKDPDKWSEAELAWLAEKGIHRSIQMWMLAGFHKFWMAAKLMLSKGVESDSDRSRLMAWTGEDFSRTSYQASFVYGNLMARLDLASAEELLLHASLLGMKASTVLSILGTKHVNAEGEIWHHVRGKHSRLWFKGYEAAECPEIWEGDLSLEGELVLSHLRDLSGCPKEVYGNFSCADCGLKSFAGMPFVHGKVTLDGNYYDGDGSLGIRMLGQWNVRT